MSDDRVRDALRVLDRPLAPPADVAERVWAATAAAFAQATRVAVTGAKTPSAIPVAADVVVDPGRDQPSPASPWRRRLFTAAAAVVALVVVAGVLASLDDDEGGQVTAAGSGAPFRARVRNAFATTSASDQPAPVPAPSADGAGAEASEQVVAHGGHGRWRVEWVVAPPGVGGPGSYEVWDRDRVLSYEADTDTYRIEDPPEEVTRVPAVAYVDLDEAGRDCDRVEHVEAGDVVAGRPTRQVRCLREASSLEPAQQEDRWVDAATGLLLETEVRIDGELAERTEVLEVDYAPTFGDDTFAVEPPDGAREVRADDAGASVTGTVLVKGREAPDWWAPRMGGGEMSVGALRGRPAVVLLWSSWCEPCVGETLSSFDREGRAREASLALVAVAANDTETAVAAKIGELGLTIPIALDEQGDVVKRWGLGGVPAYVFLDADGVVAAVRVGPLAAAELAVALDDLAAGRPVSVAPEPPPPPPCDEPVVVRAGPGRPEAEGRVYFGVAYAPGAYGSCAEPAGPYVIATDGSGLDRLSDDDAFRGVAVSSDGTLVRETFATSGARDPDESLELWLVRRSLRPRARLVERGSDPVWSHDGRRLAFVRKDPSGAVVELAVVDRDGTGERTISADRESLRLVTSPVAWERGDAGLLVAVAGPSVDTASVVRYALDGARSACVVCQATAPTVSSTDGTIAFVHLEPGDPDHRRIGLASADGTGRRFLTPPRGASVPAFYELDFSPDGAWLVASGSPEPADPYPRRRIYLVEVATGAISELASLGTRPSW